MAQAERDQDKPLKNPLIWVSIVVVGLIIFIFTSSSRNPVRVEQQAAPVKQVSMIKPAETVESVQTDGEISRALTAHPGQRARDFIQLLREQGSPYPFDKLMATASSFATEGSLADAHLVFYFAAREGHVEAMMMMAEMSDPTLFQAENNLLDQADAVQAFKWYKMAVDNGFEPAQSRLDNLHQWAKAESEYGNVAATQLLLNYQ